MPRPPNVAIFNVVFCSNSLSSISCCRGSSLKVHLCLRVDCTVLQDLARDKNGFHNGYKKAGIDVDSSIIEEDRLSLLEQEIKYDINNGDLRVNKNLTLELMLKWAFQIYQLILNKSWILISSPQKSFITSDNLCILLSDFYSVVYKPGLGGKDTKIMIPICSNLLLIMTGYTELQDQVVAGGKDLISELNKAIMANSNRYIFYHEDNSALKASLKDLKEFVSE